MAAKKQQHMSASVANWFEWLGPSKIQISHLIIKITDNFEAIVPS